MVNSLSGQLFDATHSKEARILSVRQDVDYLLKSETVPHHSETEKSQVADAQTRLFDNIQQLRVVDIALPVRELAERTKNDDLRAKVLESVEEGKSNADNLSDAQKFADQLARASIHEEMNPAKAAEQNEDVHDFLEKETGLSLKQVIPYFEEIQLYYPKENHQPHDFTFTVLQMQALDEILIDRVNDYLTSTKQTPDLSKRLAKLVSNLEDQDLATNLISELQEQDDQPVQTQQIALDLS